MPNFDHYDIHAAASFLDEAPLTKDPGRLFFLTFGYKYADLEALEALARPIKDRLDRIRHDIVTGAVVVFEDGVSGTVLTTCWWEGTFPGVEVLADGRLVRRRITEVLAVTQQAQRAQRAEVA